MFRSSTRKDCSEAKIATSSTSQKLTETTAATKTFCCRGSPRRLNASTSSAANGSTPSERSSSETW